MAGSCIVEKIAHSTTDYGLAEGYLMILCLDILMHFFSGSLSVCASFAQGGLVQARHIGILVMCYVLFTSVALRLTTAHDCIMLVYHKGLKTKNTDLIGYRINPKL